MTLPAIRATGAPSAAALNSQTDAFWWGEGSLWEAWYTGNWNGPAAIFVDKCNPWVRDHSRVSDNVSYFDGEEADFGSNTELGGVQSYIFNYSPWVWPYWYATPTGKTLKNASAAWVLLTGSPGFYYQTGWWENAYGERHSSQYTNPLVSDTPYTQFLDPPKPVDATTWYVVLNRNYYYQSDPDWVTYSVGNCPNGPDCEMTAAPWEFAPNVAQVSGEIKTLSDQMPGDHNVHEIFSNTQVYPGFGWAALNGFHIVGDDNGNGGNHFSYQPDSPTQFEIWDAAC